MIQRPLLSQIGHLTVTLGTFGKWDAITHGLSVPSACVSTYIYVIDDEKKETKIRVVIEPTYLTLIIAFEGLTESGGKL